MTIEEAMINWLDCKQKEKQATYVRNMAEKELEKYIQQMPDEGSQSIRTKRYKMTVTQTVTRKIDERKARQIFNELPEGLMPIHWVESPKLDIEGYRWLKKNDPGLFKIFCECLTEKKGKPNFKVEIIKDGI